jgi:hypothetical protein
MGLTVKVRPGELGNFERKFASRMRSEAFKDALLKVANEVQARLYSAPQPCDLGGYQRGWYALARGSSLYVGNYRPYAVVIEQGRRAGARMPPPGPILAWVLRHGMEAGAAFPVARKIAERGIAPRPLFHAEAMQKWISDRVEQALVEHLDRALAESLP